MNATSQELSPTPGPFARLGLNPLPLVLAPLAGVSDHPFRRICAGQGAHLTYVEMISSTALCHDSRRTWEIMTRHPDESPLGIQITGFDPDELGRAVAILEKQPYDTIDINMGCPVNKVVKAGCGSALLRDPDKVFRMVRAARSATDRPLSVKIRLGWDRTEKTAFAVAQAAVEAGAEWLTVHGRYRSDDYSAPVDLETIAALKAAVPIPVLGNGNIFTADDAGLMRKLTQVDGVMVSRGALGNPWVFRHLAGDDRPVTVDEWEELVLTHLEWQQQAYGQSNHGAVSMRKHLLWYLRGWPGARRVRDVMARAESLDAAGGMIRSFAAHLRGEGVAHRAALDEGAGGDRFHFDPKWDMDRQLDRGVGDDGLTGV